MCVLQPVKMFLTLTHVRVVWGSVMRKLADVPVSKDNRSVGATVKKVSFTLMKNALRNGQ